MIPKIIHYCWLSGEAKPTNVKKCIRSWKRYLPDYQIKCWDSKSFDFSSVQFVKEAYDAKKWAFVSDFIRLYALYTEGGIYLDSDVQAYECVDSWLKYDLFTGIEKRGDTSDLFIEAAIMGASKGNSTIGKCLDYYKTRRFVLCDGSLDQTPIPTIITPIFCKEIGWKREDCTRELSENSIIFSTDVISNTESEVKDSTVFYHWNNRSWVDRNFKENMFKFVKDKGMLPIWNGIKRHLKNR